MHSPHAAPDTWHPETKGDREAILRELREVLASPHFCNSKRYPALLEYVVEHTLSGNAEMLKERTLGVEVFGRPPDYDTNTDTVVRYTASEVRKRLLLYYSDLDHAPAIRISLPAGSYIPEFLHGHETPNAAASDHDGRGAHEGDVYVHNGAGGEKTETARTAGQGADSATLARTAMTGDILPLAGLSRGRKRLAWRMAAAVAAVVALAGAWWAYQAPRPQTAVSDFWAPVLRGQTSVILCTGSVVFAQEHNYSGVTTAGRDIDYPFVSMQIASAINQIGYTVDRSGDSGQLVPSATTPLTELREHSVILLGGYNNVWTMRLLDPLRFHFSPNPTEAIVDRMQPQMEWQRDQSLPYSSADDYAIVARFRDPTIDGWVVALAGLGRNGTEAAAHFATSPRYMQLLRDWMGKDFANKNIEAVVKVNVIEGKTGAPSILAVHVW